jgi:hypothetical protein
VGMAPGGTSCSVSLTSSYTPIITTMSGSLRLRIASDALGIGRTEFRTVAGNRIRKPDIYWKANLPPGVLPPECVYQSRGWTVRPTGESNQGVTRAAVRCISDWAV